MQKIREVLRLAAENAAKLRMTSAFYFLQSALLRNHELWCELQNAHPRSARKMLHAIYGMFRWEKPYDGSLVFPEASLVQMPPRPQSKVFACTRRENLQRQQRKRPLQSERKRPPRRRCFCREQGQNLHSHRSVCATSQGTGWLWHGRQLSGRRISSKTALLKIALLRNCAGITIEAICYELCLGSSRRSCNC